MKNKIHQAESSNVATKSPRKTPPTRKRPAADVSRGSSVGAKKTNEKKPTRSETEGDPFSLTLAMNESRQLTDDDDDDDDNLLLRNVRLSWTR
jgi:hypothetical protein